jgi:HEAT repeat protein
MLVTLRWEAVKTLGAIIDPGSLSTFLAVLDDQNSDLRWLAGTGLIDLGPRAVRPVLQSLNDPEVPRGHLEISHRVLGEVAKGNEVLAAIVKPLLDVLGGNDRGVIATTAARALSDLDRATGRPL